MGASGSPRQSPSGVGCRFCTSHRPVLRLTGRSVVAGTALAISTVGQSRHGPSASCRRWTVLSSLDDDGTTKHVHLAHKRQVCSIARYVLAFVRTPVIHGRRRSSRPRTCYVPSTSWPPAVNVRQRRN